VTPPRLVVAAGVARDAYEVLCRSRVLTVLPATSDGELRSLLAALHAEAQMATPEARREVYFRAFKALRETGRSVTWAAELEVALGIQYVAPEPATRPRARYPALALWRREMAAGLRTWATHDALRRAAEWESGARDLEAQGSEESAARCRATAQGILRHAERVAA
jgi:hypothetical protein